MSDETKSGRVTYALKYPVQFGTQEIAELSLRRPKGKDLRAFRDGDKTVSETLDLIGRLANQPKPVVDELDVVDIEALGAIINSFTESGRSTGAEPVQS